MFHPKKIAAGGGLLLLLIISIVSSGFAQKTFKAPETVLPEDVLRIILDEVSGQQAFNNEIMMAGYNRIRTPEEMSGYFYEADYLYKKLKEYGLDTVTIESLKLKRPDRGTWWIGHEAELRMVSPEKKLLARLAEQPALIVRGSDTVDCEGEIVFIDKPDMPKLKDMDFAGKIILTPLYPGWMVPALEKGALGVISYENSIRPIDDPDQVVFNMRMQKGKAPNKVFGFMISTRQGLQLREQLLDGKKIVVHARTVAKEYPWKADTVFAAIKGTSPEKKGVVFTAHLTERPSKIGANDNMSGCVALAEIARTLTTLIREGRIPRPERSIYFLWSEEGSGTAAFYQNHPEMIANMLCDLNMDMVGENLDQNSATFFVVEPLYSKATYMTSVVRNICEYVFRTNIEQHGIQPAIHGESFPVPIMEKNGSRGAFRYMMQKYSGSSDHAMFIEADDDIPAVSMIAWPDFWYHTDKDTPDKSDPTQLKRVAFIGASAALAVSCGREDVLETITRKTYEDGCSFFQESYGRSLARISKLGKGDGGRAFRNGLTDLTQSIGVTRASLVRLRELAAGKPAAGRYLEGMILETGKLLPDAQSRLKSGYALIAGIRGFKADILRPSAQDAELERIVPAKVNRVALGDFFPTSEMFHAFPYTDRELFEAGYQKLGAEGMMEFLFLVNGKRTLAEIRDLVGFEFEHIESPVILRMAKAFETAKLIRLGSAK